MTPGTPSILNDDEARRKAEEEARLKAAEEARLASYRKAAEAALQDIHFDYDRSDIREVDKPKLQAVADFMKTYQAAKLQIEGHCDERGTVEYNLALGERRAHAAQTYLEGLGTTEARLSFISYGKERPKGPGQGRGVLAHQPPLRVQAPVGSCRRPNRERRSPRLRSLHFRKDRRETMQLRPMLASIALACLAFNVGCTSDEQLRKVEQEVGRPEAGSLQAAAADGRVQPPGRGGADCRRGGPGLWTAGSRPISRSSSASSRSPRAS